MKLRLTTTWEIRFSPKDKSKLETDPRKALSQWEQSIQHYQEALRIDPQLKEAAQNIEVVRISMKDLADRIKKAEEAAKGAAKAARGDPKAVGRGHQGAGIRAQGKRIAAARKRHESPGSP